MNNIWKRMFVGMVTGALAQAAHDSVEWLSAGVLVTFCVIIALAPSWRTHPELTAHRRTTRG